MIKETSTWKNKIKKNKHYRSKTEVILISYFLIWKLRVAIYLQWNQSSRSQEFQKSKTFWGQRIEQCLARRNLNENLLCGTYLEGCPVDRILYPSTFLYTLLVRAWYSYLELSIEKGGWVNKLNTVEAELGWSLIVFCYGF